MSELVKKLQRIQTELKAPKGQYNSFGRYRYRSCEDILEAVKPLLAAQGCALRLYDEPVCIDGWHYIKATAELLDDGDEIGVTAYARESAAKKGMDDSQITGTASSYARKYALNGLFCIDDTEDADTDSHAAEVAAKAKTVGLQAEWEAEPSPFPAVLCKRCNRPIVDAVKKNGEIMPASEIVRRFGGLCVNCAKNEAKANKGGTSK